jgi:hypothetical protein
MDQSSDQWYNLPAHQSASTNSDPTNNQEHNFSADSSGYEGDFQSPIENLSPLNSQDGQFHFPPPSDTASRMSDMRLTLQESVDGEISEQNLSVSSELEFRPLQPEQASQSDSQENHMDNTTDLITRAHAELQNSNNWLNLTPDRRDIDAENEWVNLTPSNMQDIARPEPVGFANNDSAFLPPNANASQQTLRSRRSTSSSKHASQQQWYRLPSISSVSGGSMHDLSHHDVRSCSTSSLQSQSDLESICEGPHLVQDFTIGSLQLQSTIGSLQLQSDVVSIEDSAASDIANETKTVDANDLAEMSVETRQESSLAEQQVIYTLTMKK